MKLPTGVRRPKKRVGVPPGTLIAHPEGSYSPALKTLFEYDRHTCTECTITGAVDCASIKDRSKVSWLNIDGIQDSRTLEEVGSAFDLHPLVLEDIQNSEKRPKLESYSEYLFIILKMLRLSGDDGTIISEQVSLILGRGYVISFQETVGDVFDFVRERIRSNKGRVRRCGADYLAYSLIDAIVDNYYEVVESLEGRFEELEDEVVYSTIEDFMPRMHTLRDEYLTLRRAIWPLREMMHELLNGEHDLIDESTNAFYRDVSDHVLEVSDTVDSLRDSARGLFDLQNTQQSKQLNSRLTFLTIISTIFIPPTFLASVWGMNFHVIPELSLPWGYAGAWGVMILIGAGMIFYFRRKKWF